MKYCTNNEVLHCQMKYCSKCSTAVNEVLQYQMNCCRFLCLFVFFVVFLCFLSVIFCFTSCFKFRPNFQRRRRFLFSPFEPDDASVAAAQTNFSLSLSFLTFLHLSFSSLHICSGSLFRQKVCCSFRFVALNVLVDEG